MAVPFLSGAIEGFYGQPWTHAERVALFDWLAAWGLNTYVYAPKDDLKHRALWREPYTDEESAALRRLIEACHARGLHFIFGLSPGLDIRYGAEADRDRLRRRFEQLLALGCRHFSLLFDDTPGRLEGSDADRWNSLAAAQSDAANGVFTWIRSRNRESRFVFCPTAYCGRMAQAGLGGADYLSTVGRDLLPEIDVFWTGPEIISREIPLAHVRELGAMLRRKPIVWDNLHANDLRRPALFLRALFGPATRTSQRGEWTPQQSQQRTAAKLRAAAHAGGVCQMQRVVECTQCLLVGDAGMAAALCNDRRRA